MGQTEDLLATPSALSELIRYQAQAVVSRTILKNAGGTVTLFAFDEGESLSEHTSPYDAVIHSVDGEAEVTIAGEAHPLRSGNMLRLPAGKPHGVRAATPCKLLLIMLKSS